MGSPYTVCTSAWPAAVYVVAPSDGAARVL